MGRTKGRTWESREGFESVFECAAIGMGLVAPDGRWLRVNGALCETLGYPEEELLGKTLWEITHPDDLEACLEQAKRLLSGEEIRAYRLEGRCFKGDGSIFWALVSVSAVRDEAGELLYSISQVQDVTEHKKLEEKLARLAYHDGLTGLPNRALFLDRLGHAFDRTERTGDSLAILYLDLDGFKEVNDSLGHEAGDRLLVQFARRLKSYSRPSDTVARLGGDEFCVLLEDVRKPEEAAGVADRLVEHLTERPFKLPEGRVRVGVSIGVAERGPDGDRAASRLLCEADAAMYRAKEAARGARSRASSNGHGSLRREPCP